MMERAWLGSYKAQRGSDGSRDPLLAKEQALRAILADMDSVVVAFSGGADSAYLAYLATQVLGDRALCVTADSPSYPERQRALAVRIAGDFSLHHEIIRTDELARPEVPRQSHQSLLLLQARVVFALAHARARTGLCVSGRWEQRRRSWRLPAWSPSGPRVWGSESARRGRPAQGRHPGAVASRWLADVG